MECLLFSVLSNVFFLSMVFPSLLSFCSLPLQTVTGLQPHLIWEKLKKLLKPSGLILYRRHNLTRRKMKAKQKGWEKKYSTTQEQVGTLTQKGNTIHTNLKKPRTFKNKFSFEIKIYKKVCLFLLSVVLQWTWNIPSRERWKKMNISFHIRN